VWESRTPPFFIAQKPRAEYLPGAFVVYALLFFYADHCSIQAIDRLVFSIFFNLSIF
jgi:hypothetical protein